MQQLVADAASSGRSFADTLRASEAVTAHIAPDEIDDLLDPAGYLGSAGVFVDDALRTHADLGAESRRERRFHHVLDGPPDISVLVLSNSLGSTLEMWDPQVPDLSQHVRVVRYDLRGHGRSPVPPGPYSIADLGGDVLALLDRLGVERAHLCGLSIGGLVAMWLAAHAPERVDRLVLCCTAASFGQPAGLVRASGHGPAEGTGAVADTVVGRWFTPEFAAREPAVVKTMRDMIAATPAEGYAACCEVVGTTDLHAELASIRSPTLVVAGARDPSVPAERTADLAAGIAGARLETVADAAHLANVEQPETVTRLILEHLRPAHA